MLTHFLKKKINILKKFEFKLISFTDILRMPKGKTAGLISKYKECFAKRSAVFKTLSIDEMKSSLHDKVHELIKDINEKEISNKTLEKILICIGEKKVKGENRNEEMKKIIITFILEKYRETKKTNKKRDILTLVEQIFSVYGMWHIKMFKKSTGTNHY